LYKAELELKTIFLPTKSICAKKGKHQMLALLIFVLNFTNHFCKIVPISAATPIKPKFSSKGFLKPYCADYEG